MFILQEYAKEEESLESLLENITLLIQSLKTEKTETEEQTESSKLDLDFCRFEILNLILVYY